MNSPDSLIQKLKAIKELSWKCDMPALPHKIGEIIADVRMMDTYTHTVADARKAFEEKARLHFAHGPVHPALYRNKDDTYFHSAVQVAWQFWQYALLSATPPAPAQSLTRDSVMPPLDTELFYVINHIRVEVENRARELWAEAGFKPYISAGDGLTHDIQQVVTRFLTTASNFAEYPPIGLKMPQRRTAPAQSLVEALSVSPDIHGDCKKAAIAIVKAQQPQEWDLTDLRNRVMKEIQGDAEYHPSFLIKANQIVTALSATPPAPAQSLVDALQLELDANVHLAGQTDGGLSYVDGLLRAIAIVKAHPLQGDTVGFLETMRAGLDHAIHSQDWSWVDDTHKGMTNMITAMQKEA